MLDNLAKTIKDVRVIVASLLAIPAGMFGILEYFNVQVGVEITAIWYYGGSLAVFALVSVMFYLLIRSHKDEHIKDIQDVKTDIETINDSLSMHREDSIRSSVEMFADRFYSKNRKFTNFTMTINSEKYLHGLRATCIRHKINSHTLSTIDDVLSVNSENKRSKDK